MMKKAYLSIMAAMLFTACSNEDIVSNVDETDNGAQYMALNLVANSDATREGSDYDNGTDDEYNVKVENVVFYFFDADGNAYAVNNGYNYSIPTSIEWSSANTNGSNTTIVSKYIVVIEKQAGEAPSQVVAVLNSDVASFKSLSLADLKKELVTSGQNNIGDTNYFLMSNSVYNTSAGDVYTAAIKAENIATTADAAQESPVQIYVERVAAKVSSTLTADTEAFMVLDPDNTSSNISIDVIGSNTTTTYSGGQVTVKLLGWQIFNNPAKSTVLKSIEGNSAYSWTSWNSASNYRSFWATTAWDESVGNIVPAANRTLSYAEMLSGAYGIKYPLENTLDIENDLNTSIAFAAQISLDGTATTLVKWLSRYYTLDAAKTAIANYLRNDLYTYDATGGTWTSIAASAIGFKSVAGDFHSVVDLGLTSSDETVTSYYALNSTTPLTASQVQAILDKVPSIQIWNEGKCYYFTPITHISGSNLTGVVRNHWYQLTLKQVAGLGTPVYSESDEVDPMKPNDEGNEWYLDTQLNILSWRIVTQEVSLSSK